MEETARQKKINAQLQEDISDIIRKQMSKQGTKNLLVTVTDVAVTVDLAFAKVFISVFPETAAAPVVQEIKDMSALIKHEVSQKVKNQLRRMPELAFYHDKSQERMEKIESELRSGENPIENRDLLEKRKKS